VAYSGTTGSELPIRGFVLRELPQLYDIAFFGDHRTANLTVRCETRPDLQQWNTNLNFYDDILQKYMYDGLNPCQGYGSQSGWLGSVPVLDNWWSGTRTVIGYQSIREDNAI
jgi:hypothetical protein